MICESVPFCTVVGEAVDIFDSGEEQDVRNILGMVPRRPVTFEVPTQGYGNCNSVANEGQGTSVLEDIVKEGCVAEDANRRIDI